MCSSDWMKKGQCAPSRRQQSLTNEKLLDFPEIKQSVINKQIKWITVISANKSIANNENFAQIVSYSGGELNNWPYIVSCVTINCMDFSPNFHNQNSQSIYWLCFIFGRRNCNETYINQIFAFWCKQNYHPFLFCNNQTFWYQAISINWSASFVKIVSGPHSTMKDEHFTSTIASNALQISYNSCFCFTTINQCDNTVNLLFFTIKNMIPV